MATPTCGNTAFVPTGRRFGASACTKAVNDADSDSNLPTSNAKETATKLIVISGTHGNSHSSALQNFVRSPFERREGRNVHFIMPSGKHTPWLAMAT